MAARALLLKRVEYRLENVVSLELVTQLASTRLNLVISINYKFIG